MTTKLTEQNLDFISATAKTHQYSHSELSAGFIHFGVGNFHQAHQAVYLNALFNNGSDRDWAIIGAGVLPADEHMRQVLAAQDFLSSVVE